MFSILRSTHTTASSASRATVGSFASISSSSRTPKASTSASIPSPAGPSTHYLVTLLRSPLHLPISSKNTCESLGLRKRSATSLVPINSTNAGYILAIKELVGVKLVDFHQIQKNLFKRQEKLGINVEGRRGAGLGGMGMITTNGVVTVGKDRSAGEERGFLVVR